MADRLVKMLGLEPGFIISRSVASISALRRSITRLLTTDLPHPRPGNAVFGRASHPHDDGSVTVGPNAVLAFKREGYPSATSHLATRWKFWARRGFAGAAKPSTLRTGRDEKLAVQNGYLRLVQKYCPRLSLSDLQPGPPVCGRRRYRRTAS